MKRFLIPLLAVAIATLFAFGCKKETTVTDTGTTSTSATDTSATYSTSTVTTDTSGTGATGGTVSSLSDADKEFVMKAANGGMAEVARGQLAATNAKNADVKTFGQRMVTDHGKANDELKQFATTKGITLPAQMDAAHQKKHDDLAKKTGADFDKAYMKAMVEDHTKDVDEFKKESTAAQDADLKAWAAKTLPMLEDHLKMAKDTQKKVK